MRASGQALRRVFSRMRPAEASTGIRSEWFLCLLSEEDRRLRRRLRDEWPSWLLSVEERRLQRMAVGEWPDRAESEPYLRLLTHESPLLRLWAAVTLGRSGGPGVAARLAMMLHEKGDGRLIGAIGLGHLRDARAMPDLIDVVWHEDADLRLVGVVALGWLGRTAEPALAALSDLGRRDRDPKIRAACGYAIRCIRVELADRPTELVAAEAPAGRGTEPEATAAPAGRGTELAAADGPEVSDTAEGDRFGELPVSGPQPPVLLGVGEKNAE